MKTYTIYKHTNKINGKCYVGVTYLKPKERYRSGGSGYEQKGQWKFWSAIKKYGWHNFTHEILEENIPADIVGKHEQYWIEHFDSFRNGYNATLGGKGALGHVPTEEAKKRMGAKNIGTAHHTQKHSEETKRYIGEIHKGKHLSPRTEFKKGECRGHKFSKGHIPWNKGTKGLIKPWNKGKIGALSKASKPVLRFDLEGNFIDEFPGASEAGRQLGIDSSDIARCCRGEYHKTHGFIFKYKNNVDKQ